MVVNIFAAIFAKQQQCYSSKTANLPVFSLYQNSSVSIVFITREDTWQALKDSMCGMRYYRMYNGTGLCRWSGLDTSISWGG